MKENTRKIQTKSQPMPSKISDIRLPRDLEADDSSTAILRILSPMLQS